MELSRCSYRLPVRYLKKGSDGRLKLIGQKQLSMIGRWRKSLNGGGHPIVSRNYTGTLAYPGKES